MADCMNEAAKVKQELIESIESRKSCINICSFKLSKCIEFSEIFNTVVGEGSYNILSLASFGRMEFSDLLEYVTTLPHIMSSNLRSWPQRFMTGLRIALLLWCREICFIQ